MEKKRERFGTHFSRQGLIVGESLMGVILQPSLSRHLCHICGGSRAPLALALENWGITMGGAWNICRVFFSIFIFVSRGYYVRRNQNNG